MFENIWPTSKLAVYFFKQAVYFFSLQKIISWKLWPWNYLQLRIFPVPCGVRIDRKTFDSTKSPPSINYKIMNDDQFVITK